ncbi:hypothetical protein XENOCAPTIV_003642, partial [Xenoophorus captivus]
ENILMRIHFHIADESKEDICTARRCIPHQKFAMTLFEQCVCSSCGASSDPLPFIQMVHYISTTSLFMDPSCLFLKLGIFVMFSEEFPVVILMLGNYFLMFRLKSVWSAAPHGSCAPQQPGDHHHRPGVGLRSLGPGRGRHSLTGNLPAARRCKQLDQDRIREINLSIISREADLNFSLQLFYRVTEEKAQQAELYLVGMVCYYGKHYSTFFFQTKVRRWMYFDDAHVKEVRSTQCKFSVLVQSIFIILNHEILTRFTGPQLPWNFFSCWAFRQNFNLHFSGAVMFRVG